MYSTLIVSMLCLVNFDRSPHVLGTLAEVVGPHHIAVSDSRLFILEDSKIFKYDLNSTSDQNLRLIASFLRKGRGPGEIDSSPFRPNRMTLIGQRLFVEGPHKVLELDLDGQILSEIRTPSRLVLETLPVKGGFVTKELDRSDGKVEFVTVNLTDPAWKVVSELYRQKSPIQIGSSDMIADAVLISVNESHIFIEKSREDASVDMFHHSGKLVKTIDVSYKKRPVTDDDKADIMQAYKDDPLVKEIGFANLKNSVEFYFPEVYPGILGMQALEDQLFLLSPFQSETSEMYHLVDLPTLASKTFDLPLCPKSEDLSQKNGVGIRLSFFDGTWFYYLEEPENDDFWIVKRVRIK